MKLKSRSTKLVWKKPNSIEEIFDALWLFTPSEIPSKWHRASRASGGRWSRWSEVQLRIFIIRIHSLIGWMVSCAKSTQECSKALQDLFDRVTDESRCNNDCKWMYFCNKKRGHKGVHNDCGLTWL
jgi:hypothetical protein